MGFKESVSNRIEASYLCFDKNFDYFSGKWAWTLRVLPIMGYTGGGGVRPKGLAYQASGI